MSHGADPKRARAPFRTSGTVPVRARGRATGRATGVLSRRHEAQAAVSAAAAAALRFVAALADAGLLGSLAWRASTCGRTSRP